LATLVPPNLCTCHGTPLYPMRTAAGEELMLLLVLPVIVVVTSWFLCDLMSFLFLLALLGGVLNYDGGMTFRGW
jgi:hypothetical protein